MSADLYASVSGATAVWTRMQTLSNNVANVNSNGFKAGRIAFEVTGPNSSALGRSYVMPTAVELDMTDGQLIETGNTMDFALRGEGFFAIEGNLATRDGRFQLNADRKLVTSGGKLVMGSGGAIEIPLDETIRISEDGRIVASESGEIDRLQIVKGKASPMGNNLWRPAGEMTTIEEGFQVRQGAVEGSNVDPMLSMVELVEASRYFNAYQKAMQGSDEMNARLNRIGR
jgi:flagellar basal-body rod protein FlgF